METIKLLAFTIGLLAVIVGFFFVGFSLFAKGKKGDCSSDTDSSVPGCGCIRGACGLPIKD